MFKSVFAKYVTVVMLIFVIGFALLLFVMTSIVNNMLTDSRADRMEAVLERSCDILQKAVSGCSETDLPSKLTAVLDDPAQRLPELFSALKATDPDMSILVADPEGVILCRTEGDELLRADGATLPDEVSRTVREKKSYLGTTDCAVLSDTQVLMRAALLYDTDGHVCGIAAVSLGNISNVGMTEELGKTVVSAALLVLLAILIAVYFISDRVTSPLRGMCAAAQQFANGSFDVRVPVPVGGHDEVAQLAQAFNQMAESLENLEDLRNTFIANVTHDLRTPMTTIIGFIEEIRDGVIPPEEQDHYLEIISNEAKRLSRLVSSLLDISRIQAGDRKFTPTPFDICEMGRVILISFEQQIDEKRLEVSFECDEDRMAVLADHDAIYQIFYNICHNAVKFSRKGGMLRIRIRADRDHKVLVSVYNDGQGIPVVDLPYVFERFYKSDKSRGLDKSGVGLGLFIAKTIIQAHGERIWVESEEGKWCEFFFTLPRTDQPLKGADT